MSDSNEGLLATVPPPEWDDAPYELPLAATISINAMESLLPPPPLEVVTRKSFVAEFVKAKGPPQIVILVILLALGFGSTIGVVSCSRRGFGTLEVSP
jgi:hypothetical protein